MIFFLNYLLVWIWGSVQILSYIMVQNINWVSSCGNVSSGICGQRRPRSVCASAQSDQGLHCPFPESLDTMECINGEQKPRWNLTHAHDLNPHILRMLEGILFAWRSPIYKMSRGIDTHSEEVALKIDLPPFWKGICSKRNDLLPWISLLKPIYATQNDVRKETEKIDRILYPAFILCPRLHDFH